MERKGKNMVSGAVEDSLPARFEATALTKAAEDLSEDVVEILWRRRRTILAITILAVAAGVMYLQRATPLYRSTARLYVEQTGPRALEKDAPGVVARWNTYLHTQAELLQGTSLLTAAMKAPGMEELKTFTGISDPVAALRRGLHVVVGKQDEIINISFLCPYGDEAAQIVNTLVDTYISASQEHTSNLSADVVKVLQEERVKRDAELNKQRQMIMEFELKNEGLISGTDQNYDVVTRTLERLRLALADAQLATLDSKAYQEMCKRMTHDPSGLRKYVENQAATRGSGIVSGQAAALRADLQRLERERADCLQRLRPDTPAIAALDAEIAQVHQQLLGLDKEFAATQLVVAEQQFQAAQEREKELRTYFEQERRAAVLLKDQMAQYTLLQSDYQQTKAFRDLLDERIRVLSVDPQVTSLKVEIIEAAQPRTSPSKPQRAQTMGLALCMGLFAGVGLSLALEWKNQRLRSPQEISALLQLPVLGTIPPMTSPKHTRAIRGQKVRISPNSCEAEAFRTIRTAILYRAHKEAIKTILVTSPVTGEGKSTVVSNLAISMADAGQKVLVVDADLRRPMQHVLFGIHPGAKGLTSVLAGKMTVEQALEHTSIQNLSILPCGPTADNPAELINSEDLTRIVKQLAEQYDRVIIDSPPAVLVTDAQILATRCDATVLVLRAQKSTQKISLQANHSLASVDARILGVVVNDLPPSGDYYGYYGYYGSNGHRRGHHRVRGNGERMVPKRQRERQATT